MPIRVKCRSCSNELRLKDTAAGKTIKCRKCDYPIRVPQADSEWDSYGEEEYEPLPRHRPSIKRTSGSLGTTKRKRSAKKSNQAPVIIGAAIGGVAMIVVVVAIPMLGGFSADSVVSTDDSGGADSTGSAADASRSGNAGEPKSTSPDNSEQIPQPDSSGQISQFDHDAWNKASEQFRANGIKASLGEANDIGDLGTGLTHVAIIDLPLPRIGKMPDDLWPKISPVSHIYVRTENMTGFQLLKLAEHPGLVGLTISRRYVGTGEGLVKLQKHPLFRVLHLSVPMRSNNERLIGELVELRALGLNHESVSNETVAFITNMTELRSLSLQNSSVDDDGISHIVKLTKLQTLFLDGSKVTDAGLKSLEKFESLSMLSVRDLAVSPKTVADLQAALPDCKILK